jgi:acetolactate synthase regulatory subunit
MSALPADPSCRPVLFEVSADHDPGLLPRILAAFARRDLAADSVRATRRAELSWVEIGVDALPGPLLPALEADLRRLIGVRRVGVMLRARPRAA